MPSRTTYHVTPATGGWKVQQEGGSRASARAATKAEAISRARQLAKAAPLGQVVIHKKDGTIQTEHTYGEDPERYPG